MAFSSGVSHLSKSNNGLTNGESIMARVKIIDPSTVIDPTSLELFDWVAEAEGEAPGDNTRGLPASN